MSELLFKDEVYAIVGAAFEVYNELGCGFLEAVYEEAMSIALAAKAVPFVSQAPVRIRFRQKLPSKQYIADFICYGAVLVEIKAQRDLTTIDEAQLLNYLKATGLRVGLLINFGSEEDLEWKRFVR